ncbi:Dabb family protein [Ensifer adhaerens]|uniref:Dabb family protein n=1 Tax=Ensifer adhaerens TaxID=106592 RepID=UPI000B5B5EC0|nr:Dabb family protein [Ensifer adhaerens]MDF8352550.1 Dabb family protein [Ensifer adhaerens]OWZ92550.1 stress responsive protein [Sinorhizobium sp. LM21]THA66248.1 Dabb family protein [Ensifer adhaerens]
MIRHCVFIRFRPEISSEEKAVIFGEIAALKARLPGFMAAHIGSNVSPEEGMDKGFAEGFIVDFTDAAARDAYLEDEEHRKTGAKIVAAAEGGIAGIFVYDLEIAG